MVDPFVVPLIVREAAGIRREAWPVTVGVPFPHNAARDLSHLALETSWRRLPFQAEALVFWPNDSVKWALLDFVADVEAGQSEQYQVRALSSPNGQSGKQEPRLKEKEGFLRVRDRDRGLAFEVDADAGEIRLRGGDAVLRLSCAASEGQTRCSSSWDCPEVDASGPFRTAVCMPGRFLKGDEAGVFCLFRVEIYHQAGLVKLEQLVLNDCDDEEARPLDWTGLVLKQEGVESRTPVWRWARPGPCRGREKTWERGGDGWECLWPVLEKPFLPGMAKRSVLWCVPPGGGQRSLSPKAWVRALETPLHAVASPETYERSRAFHAGWSPDPDKQEAWRRFLQRLESELSEIDVRAKRGDRCLAQAFFQAACGLGSAPFFLEALAQAAWDADKGTVHHGASEGCGRDPLGRTAEDPLFTRAEGLFLGYCLTGDLWWCEAGIDVADRLTEVANSDELFDASESVGERLGSLLSQLAAAYGATYDKAYAKAMRRAVYKMRSKDVLDRVEGLDGLGECAYGVLCYHWVTGDEDAAVLSRKLAEKACGALDVSPSKPYSLLAPLLFAHHLTGEDAFKEKADRVWDAVVDAWKDDGPVWRPGLGTETRSLPMALRLL